MQDRSVARVALFGDPRQQLVLVHTPHNYHVLGIAGEKPPKLPNGHRCRRRFHVTGHNTTASTIDSGGANPSSRRKWNRPRLRTRSLSGTEAKPEKWVSTPRRGPV